MFGLPARSATLACFAFAFASCSLADESVSDVDPLEPNRLLLHVCEIDGSPIRPLVSDLILRHKFDRQGTPEVSADGKRVAFDAWSSGNGFTWQESRIIVLDIDGKNARDISDGVMPSFSPDATKLVVSRPQKYAKKDGAKGMSIWTIDADGKNKDMIADQGAWGGRWSPDGDFIAFFGGKDGNGDSVPKSCLRLYDVKTGKTRNAFDPADSPFRELSFHFEWDKGKDRVIAFGGQLKDGSGSGSATIDIDDGVKTITIVEPLADGPRVLDGLSFDWHPNGKSILVTGIVDGRPFPVALSITDEKSDLTFAGIPDDVIVRDPIYTPDGQNMIASFGPYSKKK